MNQEKKPSAKDMVLILLAKCPANKLVGITRIEKLAYLMSLSPAFQGLAQELAYEPLHYGPYSDEIAEAVDILADTGFVESEQVKFELQTKNRGDEIAIQERQEVNEYVETRRFSLTKNGGLIANYLFGRLTHSQQQEIERITKTYGGLDLADLIEKVYAVAPDEMLSRSVIKNQMGCNEP
jgi:uncharacterized protein YwgA